MESNACRLLGHSLRRSAPSFGRCCQRASVQGCWCSVGEDHRRLCGRMPARSPRPISVESCLGAVANIAQDVASVASRQSQHAATFRKQPDQLMAALHYGSTLPVGMQAFVSNMEYTRNGCTPQPVLHFVFSASCSRKRPASAPGDSGTLSRMPHGSAVGGRHCVRTYDIMLRILGAVQFAHWQPRRMMASAHPHFCASPLPPCIVDHPLFPLCCRSRCLAVRRST